jgi:hypothetical protein
MGYMAAPEPSRAGRQDPEPRDTWQSWSPPKQRHKIQSRGTCGSAGALPSREIGSDIVGHVVVCLSYLGLKLVCGVPGLQGTDSGSRPHLERGCKPVGGANSSTPLLVILNFLLDS